MCNHASSSAMIPNHGRIIKNCRQVWQNHCQLSLSLRSITNSHQARVLITNHNSLPILPSAILTTDLNKRPNYVTSCGSAVEIWRCAGCGKLVVVLRESRTQLPTTETAKFGWLNKKMTPRLSQHFRLAGVIYLENKSWDAFLWIYHI